ncbi:MAG: hypothetical protein K1X72_24950 [Pyrinomonadaceae bacterium]|nr:hypothetical protein [Pyrinomonadaceae bacterium]
MFEREEQESGKVFALSLFLMNVLILAAIVGIFWLLQIVLMQVYQISSLLYSFRI